MTCCFVLYVKYTLMCLCCAVGDVDIDDTSCNKICGSTGCKTIILTVTLFVCLAVTTAVLVQEIDSLLAGGLTAEDEDDVQQELEQIIKVYCMCIQLLMCALRVSCLTVS